MKVQTSTVRFNRRALAFCALVVCGTFFNVSAARAEEPKQPSPLSTEQERIAAQFRRFEDVILRMSELTAATDPRRAALLRKAVARSKELRLSGRLEELPALLNEDLGGAVSRQKDIHADLNQLLAILLSEQRDARLKSEQERLKEQIRQIKELINEERRLQSDTARDVDANRLAKEQAKTAEKTGKLADEMKKHEDASRAPDTENPDSNSKPGDASESEDSPSKEGESKDGAKNASENSENPSQSDQKQDDSKEGKREDKQNKENADGEKSDKPSDKQSEDRNAKEENSEESKDAKSPRQGKPSEGKPSQRPSKEQQQGSDSSEQSQSEESESQESPKNQERSTAQRVRAAQKRMQQAQQKLEKAEKEGVTDEQEQAIRELEQAKAELEEILRQLREEEMQRTLEMLEARFRKMLEMQNQVYAGTRRINDVPQAQRTRAEEVESSRLSRNESMIVIEAEKALALLREDGTAVAMPEALDQLVDDMNQIVARLAEANVGDVTIALEEDAIAALEEMIEAVQEAKRDLEKKQQQQGQMQDGTPGDPALIEKLAELRMIRSLQMRVNKRTQRYTEIVKEEEGQAVEPDLLEALRRLAEREDRIFQATRDLAEGKTE